MSMLAKLAPTTQPLQNASLDALLDDALLGYEQGYEADRVNKVLNDALEVYEACPVNKPIPSALKTFQTIPTPSGAQLTNVTAISPMVGKKGETPQIEVTGKELETLLNDAINEYETITVENSFELMDRASMTPETEQTAAVSGTFASRRAQALNLIKQPKILAAIGASTALTGAMGVLVAKVGPVMAAKFLAIGFTATLSNMQAFLIPGLVFLDFMFKLGLQTAIPVIVNICLPIIMPILSIMVVITVFSLVVLYLLYKVKEMIKAQIKAAFKSIGDEMDQSLLLRPLKSAIIALFTGLTSSSKTENEKQDSKKTAEHKRLSRTESSVGSSAKVSSVLEAFPFMPFGF